MSTSSKYYTRQGLADYLGLSIKTIYNKRIPFKHGLITLEEFDNWRQITEEQKAQKVAENPKNRKGGFATV